MPERPVKSRFAESLDAEAPSASTCGNCQHWHRQPTDAGSLGQKPHGECRESPPAVTLLPVQVPGGGQGVSRMCGYPLLQADFLACSRFKQKVDVAT